MINSPAVALNSVAEKEMAVSARGDEVAASSSGRLQTPETGKKEKKANGCRDFQAKMLFINKQTA